MARTKKVMTVEAIAIAIDAAGGSTIAPGVTIEAIADALAKLNNDGRRKPKAIANQLQAERAKPGVHRVHGAPGLYLRKGTGSAGAWFRRYWSNGKRREMGFGALSKVSLAEARKKAHAFDTERDDGNAPLELRRTMQRKTVAEAIAGEQWNFITATEAYLGSHAHSWKHPRAREIWHNPLVNYAYPVIGTKPLNSIRVEHIDKIMTAATEAGAPKVAPRIRLRIEQILNAAEVKGKRDALLKNPASIKLIKAIRPMPKNEGENFRRIDVDKAPAAFQRLMELAAGSTALSTLVFMILTAARPSEAINATWDEIDLDKPAVDRSQGADEGRQAAHRAVELARDRRARAPGDGAHRRRGVPWSQQQPDQLSRRLRRGEKGEPRL
jgi:integrase